MKIGPLNNSQDFVRLRDACAPSNVDKVDVTFWGTRVVKLKNTRDYLKIDLAAKRLMEKEPVFSELDFESRKAGLELYIYLGDLHRKSDQVLASKNIITRVFVLFRELFGIPRGFVCTPISQIQHGFGADDLLKYAGNQLITREQKRTLHQIYDSRAFP